MTIKALVFDAYGTLYDVQSVAAVTDFYRDVFNVFGYVIRVARHWRKHRIWSMPSSFELIKKGKG